MSTKRVRQHRSKPALTAPVPPFRLPPGRLILAENRGEFFLRDTGGTGAPVLLIHGWMFPSDLNYGAVYEPLRRAGYRVLAMDLRGHGRGLRSGEPFRLVDCADDAAAVLRAIGVDSVLVVGYSMGGPVAQLLAQRHSDTVKGLVLCATALDWSDPRQKMAWRTMGGLRLLLGLAPRGVWQTGMRLAGAPSRESNWVASELSRGSARDLAEAGRELGRFDSSGWCAQLSQPRAVVVMTRDRLVPPRKQRALAAALEVEPMQLDADHDACSTQPAAFLRTVLAALRQLNVPESPVASASTSASASGLAGSPRIEPPSPDAAEHG